MYECTITLVILTELRTGGDAFLVIQCFCKKWGGGGLSLILISTMNSTWNNIKRTKD